MTTPDDNYCLKCKKEIPVREKIAYGRFCEDCSMENRAPSGGPTTTCTRFLRTHRSAGQAAKSADS